MSIKKDVANIVQSLKYENLEPTKDEIELLKKAKKGEISKEEYKKNIVDEIHLVINS